MNRANTALLLAGMFALQGDDVYGKTNQHGLDWWGDAKHPDDRGRRDEKNKIALAKADEKRKRRAAKRAADCPKSESIG